MQVKRGRSARRRRSGNLYVFAGSAGSSVNGRFSLPCVGDPTPRWWARTAPFRSATGPSETISPTETRSTSTASLAGRSVPARVRPRSPLSIYPAAAVVEVGTCALVVESPLPVVIAAMAVLLLGWPPPTAAGVSPGGGPPAATEPAEARPSPRNPVTGTALDRGHGSRHVRDALPDDLGVRASASSPRQTRAPLTSTMQRLIEQSGCGVVPERADQQVETRRVSTVEQPSPSAVAAHADAPVSEVGCRSRLGCASGGGALLLPWRVLSSCARRVFGPPRARLRCARFARPRPNLPCRLSRAGRAASARPAGCPAPRPPRRPAAAGSRRSRARRRADEACLITCSFGLSGATTGCVLIM